MQLKTVPPLRLLVIAGSTRQDPLKLRLAGGAAFTYADCFRSKVKQSGVQPGVHPLQQPVGR